MTAVIFLVTILILVLIHEFGHFLAAKKFNIKVLEFGFGIPPRIFGKRFKETIFSLNWLPFGGFVKLLGEDEEDPKALADPRSFASQSVYKKIIVVAAGVVMNLLLAWMLFWLVLGMQGNKVQVPLIIDHKFIGVNQSNEKIIIITQVSDNSPASGVGIKAGDRIVAFNSQPLADSGELIIKIKENAGKNINLTLTDTQKKDFRQVNLIPRENPPEGQGALGVSLGSFTIANLEYQSILQKITAGPIHSFNVLAYSMQLLQRTIGLAVQTRDFSPVSQTVAGPVGITSLIGQILTIKNPLVPYLEFLAMLSLNLAIVNVLPFPGLDGGRLLFLGIEAVTKKKAHPTIEKYIHSIGLVILIGLMLLITFADLKKLFF